MVYNFDWTDLTLKNLKAANASREEDEIIAYVELVTNSEPESSVYFSADNNHYYMVDVHHEKYVGERPCFDLEVYESNENGEHLKWLFSIKDIKTATHLRRFCKRAEDLIVEKLYWQEWQSKEESNE